MVGRSARWLRAHPVAGFFALAYTVSWTIWLPLVLDPSRAVPGRAWYALHFAGLTGPAIAAIVVAGRIGGVRRSSFLRRLSLLRIPSTWAVGAWLLPFALYVIAAVGLAVAGRGGFDLGGLGRFEKLPGLGWLGAWAVLLLIAAPGEEVGWRGWALPELQRRHGPLTATLLLVPGWAAWHLPMFVYDPVFAAMGTGGIAGWLISLAAGAVVLTWLFNASGEHVAPPVAFHAATNAVFMSAAAAGPAGGIVGA
ncbi:MAG: CPBP family intramembrane metalloprotease, partial [Gemmatimonadales bacterium]